MEQPLAKRTRLNEATINEVLIDDVLMHIFSYCLDMRVQLQLVCKRWRKVLLKYRSLLFKTYVQPHTHEYTISESAKSAIYADIETFTCEPSYVDDLLQHIRKGYFTHLKEVRITNVICSKRQVMYSALKVCNHCSY